MYEPAAPARPVTPGYYQPRHHVVPYTDPYDTGAQGQVELAAERGQMVWIPGPDNAFIAVPRHTVPEQYLRPAPVLQPRDLTPVPLIDPVAQRIAAYGIGAGAAGAGIGWGVGQALLGIAAIGTGSGLLVMAALLLLAKCGGGTTTNNTSIHHESHVTNRNRWWGRSSTDTWQ